MTSIKTDGREKDRKECKSTPQGKADPTRLVSGPALGMVKINSALRFGSDREQVKKREN